MNKRRLQRGAAPLPGQLPLPFEGPVIGSTDARIHELSELFSSFLGSPVDVTVVDCVDPMVSSRRVGSKLKLRIHKAFLDAPRDVLAAAARYLSGGGRSETERMQEYLASDGDLDPNRASAAEQRTAVGSFFDLEEIMRELNDRHLAGRYDGAICWGRRAPARRRRSIRLGSYEFQGKLIRIHPALDRDFVPKYYVEWIVYHEMLHQLVPEIVKNGRRYFHGPGFKKLERAFPAYRKAQEWQEMNLEKLLE